jgi:hypothetical protein
MVTIKELEHFKVQIKQARKNILDLLEVSIGESPQWGLVRGKVMNCFGRDGLEGAVQELIDESNGRKNETNSPS